MEGVVSVKVRASTRTRRTREGGQADMVGSSRPGFVDGLEYEEGG